MNKLLISTLLLITGLYEFGHGQDEVQALKVMSGQYWKEQAISDILPPWTKYARDTAFGAFFTNLDESWNNSPDTRKYPGMIGRHVFSYSVTYLLTGDDSYLAIAEETKTYLIEKAWDKEYGGWYAALNRNGTTCDSAKNLFTQSYAATGLAMYYFVTHDPEALEYLEKTYALLESRAWDKEYGGYYNLLSRDWQVTDTHKSVSSQLAPVSGYLLYHYMATRNPEYLEQAQKIMDLVTDRMTDPRTGWVPENFERDWTYIPADPDEINVGHNLEVAWVLLRLYMLDHKPAYLHHAALLDTKLNQYGFAHASGMWRTALQRADAGKYAGFTYWWIQAYGNMYKLVNYHQTKETTSLSDFTKGAGFWDSFFQDKKFGDNYFSVDTSGKAEETKKGNPYKTSYHSMEQCLLNYIYLNTWVNKAPVELYFRIKSPSKNNMLYPIPIEDKNIRIKKAILYDGGKKADLESRVQCIRLPLIRDINVKVTLGNKVL